MSTLDPLRPDDFPLTAVGQYVYRRSCSSPIIGPVSMQLAADLAARLNREEEVTRALKNAAAHGEPLVLHGAPAPIRPGAFPGR